MAWMLTAFFAYMAFILVVGVIAGRRTRGKMESFYLGDRKVGAWVTAISASASSESGWLVLGCVAMGYVWGVTAYWITIGCLLGFAFNWFFFAERVRRVSKEHGAVTVPELLERATDARTKLVRLIGVLIIFVVMFTYVAAQLNAAGIALESVFGWAYWIGVLIGAVITIFYTTLGGYRAVSWTDLFQGLLMVAALVVLPIVAWIHMGGGDEVDRRVRERNAQTFTIFSGTIDGEHRTVRVENDRWALFDEAGTHRLTRLELPDPETGTTTVYFGISRPEGTPTWRSSDGALELDLAQVGHEGTLREGKTHHPLPADAFFSFAGGMIGLILLGWVIEMLGIGLGYPGSPHVVTRFMAAKSEREIKKGRVIALSWALLAESGAITMGILARALHPDLADPQWGLLATAEMFLHPVLVGLILAAVFAAMRSTADSQLLVASSAVVRDLCQHVMKRDLDEKKAMRISRWVVVVLGALAVLLALTENRFIFWFILFAWAGLGASFGPALILAVWWRRLSAGGVIASMLTGFTTTLAWKLWAREAIQQAGGPDVYELVPAFFLSFAAAVVFSLLFPRREAAKE